MKAALINEVVEVLQAVLEDLPAGKPEHEVIRIQSTLAELQKTQHQIQANTLAQAGN